ncbi:hypothetical protein TNCV_2049661 [Trichonephila clavipes]|nr:hypothetical protein TNCV_2049661 [Trichonephila clavipes]
MDFGDISNSQWNESISENNNLTCKDCKVILRFCYSQQKSLNRHIKTFHSLSSYICTVCKRTFNRIDNLRRHQSVAYGCPFVQKKKKKKKTTSSTSESSSRIRVHCYSEKENAASLHPMLQMMMRILDPSKLSNSTRKKVFSCFECGKVFYQKETVLINM